MISLSDTAVFFDIGNTLASVALSSTGDRIDHLAVYSYVPEVLTELRECGARLGVISDRGPVPESDVNAALAAAGLGEFLAPELVLYGRKSSPSIFEQAARRASELGLKSPRLFVGEDAAERAQALIAGFLVAPHPRLAAPVLEEHARLRYLRIVVPQAQEHTDWRDVLQDLPLLPVHVTGDQQSTVYAIATATAAARLDDLGFSVDRLGAEDEPLTTELYLLRDDRQAASGFLQPAGNSVSFFSAEQASQRILTSTEEGLFAAIPAGRSVEGYHFRGAQHGHTLKLVPSTALLETLAAGANGQLAAEDAAGFLAPASLNEAEKEALRPAIRPEQITEDVERYSGLRSADPSGLRIHSRHVHHADNGRAVETLVRDLERIGAGRFVVRRRRFTHEGLLLDNVEAEFAGTGPAGIVLVTAHLDSTGARLDGYRARLDAAPGADDDASGIAGVLAAARTIETLDAALGLPRRTVRFVLFNAEEHGLVGSTAYARDQAALAAGIVAVFQLDMIGYDVQPDRTFELHAGFTPSVYIQDQSLRLARLVADLAPQISPGLPAPQIYPPDSEIDPAERRSDHYSFQAEGYPACLASEDFFAGPGSGAPRPEPNPMYHLPTDTVVNSAYVADIARLMTAAVWVSATR